MAMADQNIDFSGQIVAPVHPSHWLDIIYFACVLFSLVLPALVCNLFVDKYVIANR